MTNKLFMLSIVIPTYNESEIIEESVKEILKLKNIELIISDGGSTDNTLLKIKKFKQSYKNVKVIENKIKGRKGLDIENGIKICSSKFCIFVDADLSCGISGILKVSKELKNHDLVIGYRVSNKKRTFLRNFLTRSYILLINFLFKMKIKDYQCGLKGFRKEKILPILEKIKNKDFFWDTELIIRSQKSNLKIKEVPVTWIEKRKSKIKVLRTSLKFLLKIIKFKLLY